MKKDSIARNIREEIASFRTKVVCFDVFDTLLVRPVISPTDLFYLVERRIEADPTIPNVPFSNIRPKIEQETRKRLKKVKPFFEDVCLDEIYDTLSEFLLIDREISQKIMEIELSVEMDYLKARTSVKELYDHAVSCGKTIIVASDVYLPQDFIIKVLKANGYTRIDRYFISSELRLSKSSGNMFLRIMEDMSAKAGDIVHIGDNPNADLKKPLGLGIRAFQVIRPSQMMFSLCGSWDILRKHSSLEPSFRLSMGLIANKIFDPLKIGEWKKGSLFNGNPYFFGYYGMGPFLFFMTKWLIENLVNEKNDLVAFIARDGFLPMKVYNTLAPFYPDAPPSKYLRLSRSVCYPFDMENAACLIMNKGFPAHFNDMSGREVIASRLLMDITPDFEKYFVKNGINIDKPVNSSEKMMHLMSVACKYGEAAFSEIRRVKDLCTDYCREFFCGYNNAAVFDCGYTARAQRILADILDSPPSGYYIQSFGPVINLGEKGMKCANFLGAPYEKDVFPHLVGTAITEISISEFSAGSVIDFQRTNEGVEPILESDSIENSNEDVLLKVHRGCLDFVMSMIATFKVDIKVMNATPYAASDIVRQFMDKPHIFDAKIFDNLHLSGGITGKTIPIIGETRAQSRWQKGFDILRGNKENDNDNIISGKRIYYRGQVFSFHINKLRKLPAVDFLEVVSLLAREPVDLKVQQECRQIVRTRSKWLAAAVILQKSGGVWHSKAPFLDKCIAQMYLLSCKNN